LEIQELFVDKPPDEVLFATTLVSNPANRIAWKFLETVISSSNWMFVSVSAQEVWNKHTISGFARPREFFDAMF